jgi:tRNA A-37 threonylcarbamoyl transferase component Bud32
VVDDDRTLFRPPPALRRSGRDAPSPASPAAFSTSNSDWVRYDAWANAANAADEDNVGLGAIIRGRYELESVVGEGTMGVVYRAVDRLHKEMQDRDPYVAIKILSREFKRHPNALITLQREVRKAQLLAHENIIAVHSFDRDGSIVFMTMELLDGKELRSVIAENDGAGLPAADVVPMVRGMAKALAYAHDNGIVHSDFKPGNVFLTHKGQIKVLDFGVARATPVKPRPGADVIVDAYQLGGLTPAYASPEMLRGEDPEPADDVFALAVVVYELLTGRHPFDSGPPTETRLHALGAEALPGLSRPQRKALRRAFSVERSARQQSAAQFLTEFNGTSTGKKVAQAGLGAAAMVPVMAFLVSTHETGAPEVAFEDLPAEVQTKFIDAMQEGDTAMTFGDAAVNDALHYYSEAYRLHAKDPRAIAGLEAVADRFLSLLENADVDAQRGVFTLLHCQEYLSSYRPVMAACNGRLGADACRAIAATCAAKGTSE